jgi:hypothetical protein
MTEKSQFSQVLGIVVTIAKAFLFRKWVVFIIIGAALLAGALAYSVSRTNKWKGNSERLMENLSNIDKANKVLTLNVKEWKSLSGEYKNRADSAIRAEKLRTRQVEQVTLIKTEYRDTGSVKIVYRDAVQQPDGRFTVPVSYDSVCWGFKGKITSIDPAPVFDLTERRSSNSTSLIVTRPKYFLFIRIKKAEYRLKTDCGEGNFTKIDFVK